MRVGGERSPNVPVLSGVPQGSVLGPLLFLIYINDVSSIQLSEGAKINLYADDMLLFKQIKTHEDFCHLQSDIIKVNTWVEQNHLTLNTTKCKFMLVTKKRTQPQPCTLSIKGKPLENVKQFKYLGVLLTILVATH